MSVPLQARGSVSRGLSLIKDRILAGALDEDPVRVSSEPSDTPRASDTSLDNSCVNSGVVRPGRADHAFRTLYCTSCLHWFKVPIACGDRLCLTCARRRAERYRRYLREMVCEVLGRGDRVRFVTLTVRNCRDLSEGLGRLLKAQSRLRERRVWQDHVIGGVYSIEVTNAGNGRGWHIHSHSIVEGTFFPQVELKAAWREVTGDDSFIVDIRVIKDSRSGLTELMKYPFKPADARAWTKEMKAEFDSVLEKRRLFTTFGTWHGAMVSKDSICPHCGSRNTLRVLDFEPLRDDVVDGCVNQEPIILG